MDRAIDETIAELEAEAKLLRTERDAALADLERIGALFTDRELEIRLLRRERRLLIDMDKAKSGILGRMLNGGRITEAMFGEAQRLQVEVLKLHWEASGGIVLPEGTPCQCLLCAPKRDLQPGGMTRSHHDDPQSFGAVLPCGHPDCRQPNCPTAGENYRRSLDNKAGLLHGDPDSMDEVTARHNAEPEKEN